MDINSELKDAQIEIRDTDNAYNGNRKGLIWFNRAVDKIKGIFNSEVKTIATEDWVNDLVTTGVETDLDNYINDIEANGVLTDEQATDPATPASGKVRIFARDNNAYTIDDNGDIRRLRVLSDNITTTYAGNYTIGVTQTVFTAPFDCYARLKVNDHANGTEGLGVVPFTVFPKIQGTENVEPYHLMYLKSGEKITLYKATSIIQNLIDPSWSYTIDYRRVY
jgi:hypothetical protein